MQSTTIKFLVIISFFSMVACASTSNSVNVIDGEIAIHAIAKNPDFYVGKEVVVWGEVKGWKGSCLSPPPLTRSDWMIEDDGQCIYVSGDLPVGLNALNPSGEKISVKATIKIDRTGKPYLAK
jgi:hypothetical protein